MTTKLRKPNRLKFFDYSLPGYYFITICTRAHKNIFGRIIKDKMVVNDFGKIVAKNLLRINILHNNIEIDYFIVMPNHLHFILIVNVVDAKFASTTNEPPEDRTKMLVSKIIQQFKRASTLEIKQQNAGEKFRWQRSFYDRIIRNEKELYNIRKYITENPLKWQLEKNITENLELV